MRPSPARPPRHRGPWAGGVSWLVLLAGVAAAQTPPATPSVPPVSREELLRRYDLDSDGRIDPSEADLGRAKARLDRLDQERKREIDPLTGRPRGAAEDPDAAASPRPPITGIDDLLPPQDAAAGSIRERKDTSGGRGRDGRRPASTANGTEARAKGGSLSPRKGSGLFGSGKSAERNSAAPSAPVTGGVRAGAPPARPGYGATAPGAETAGGALPRKDRPLNAGRPRDSILPGGPSGSPGIGGRSTAPAPRSGLQSGRSSPRSADPAPAPRQPLLPDRLDP